MYKQLISEINQNITSAKACVVPVPEGGAGEESILIEQSSLFDVCKFLYQKNFKVLQVISGVDYQDYIEVCYMLANFDLGNSQQFILKTRVTDRLNPELDSVVAIWKSANFQERECFDMFGVKFRNHPDPRRILCPDDWEGFPLRKDYVAAKTYRGMDVFPDHKMNMEDREYIVRQKQIIEEAKKRSLDKGL